MMPRINLEAIEEAGVIWDDEGKEMKVRAIYDGFRDSFLPSWIRFPTLSLERNQESVMGFFGPQDFSC